jgi:hypothetical protein
MGLMRRKRDQGRGMREEEGKEEGLMGRRD